MNVCKRIQCPFSVNTSGTKQGCTRYGTPNDCHIYKAMSGIKAGEYWLWESMPGYLDYRNIRLANKSFIEQDKESQKRLRETI